MGQKKAIMATAHLLLIIAYHILKDLKPYEELGVDYYKAKQHDPVKLMIKKLSQAGYTVVAAS
jgi:transposase